jgi:aminoglycoside phosphotransferase (APT) family kinase protein
MADHVDGAVGPIDFAVIAGGRSNLTYLATGADGARWVLRRPPLGNVLATAHDMAREHRIISAISSTSVPTPRPLALCEDPSVTGAVFYVMSHVPGVVLDAQARAETMTIEARRDAAAHLIDVLADLHALDVDEIGLGDLARREGYIERQLKRWSRQWEQSKTRELPAIDEVLRRLSAEIPTQQGVAVAHGDYRFGNCLVDPVAGRVVAVLDWELCTLGDPLADVGYLGVYWTDPGDEPRLQTDASGLEGFGTYAGLLERYASRTGRDLSGIGYYVAFSSWRLAVISEGVYARYLHGAMGDAVDPQILSSFAEGTETLAESALAALGGDDRARWT